MTFFKNCDEYFGPDFMQFIIPIFTTNSKPDEHSVYEAEHAVEHLLPKLRSFKPHEHIFIMFENNAARSEKVVQIDKLTKLIANMQMANTGTNKYYSNESEKVIQQKEKVDQKISQSKHPEITTLEDVFSQEDTLGIP
jgi:archaellum biogenesis ATPase FlaH